MIRRRLRGRWRRRRLWWEASRVRRVWRHPWTMRWGRLSAFLALEGAVWAWLHWIHQTSITEDQWLLALVVVTWGLAMITMLYAMVEWSIRGLGVLGTVQGDCAFYGAFLVAILGWGDRAPAWMLELGRSAFIVGSPFFIVGMLLYARDEWTRRRTGHEHGSNGDVV